MNYSKELKKIFLENNCYITHQGKDDYEMWFSPISNQGFIVENDISSNLTADAVLKHAGLDQVFSYKNKTPQKRG